MTESIWPTIHAERRSLADELTRLTAEQWATRSLCTEWTVSDVLAHMVSAAKMTPPKFFRRFAAAGFNFDRYVGGQIVLEGAAGPEATLDTFRAVAGRESSPPGPDDSWLGEAFVHGEDIRRPLGIAHEYPLPMIARTIAFYARSNLIIGGRNRVKGLTLAATDVDCKVGDGPVVEGPAISLLLAATGRKIALEDLTGPGLAVLRDRP